jgi:flagella basal body P-ring formation protein FlgA
MQKELAIGIRVSVLILAVTAGILVVIAGARSALASPVYLKSGADLSGNRITLGDIFGGLESNADKVLGHAPQPGSEIVLNARTLLRIAVALDLPWRPASGREHIVLTRSATIIGEEQIKTIISEKLRADNGLSGPFDITFTSSGNKLILPKELSSSAEITEMDFNPGRDWFQVTLAAPSADNPVSRLQLTGAVRHITKVPVLKTSLRSGDIIQVSDIKWIELYTESLQHDIYLEADKIVGMTPRRMAVAGKPVREIDLEAPKIVERGETVTIIYEQGPMRLTAEGRALRDGAKGDFVRAVNNSSSQTVEGTVIASRTIVVR